MRQLVLLCFALLVAASCASCVDTQIPKTIAPAESKDKPSGKQPGSHKNNMPVMGSYQVISTKVEELSGLCMNQDTTGFWAVGDGGDLCQVSFSGIVTRVLHTRLDFEGVTIDPATGDLYVVVEGDQMVCRIAAPAYNAIDTLFYVQEAVEGDFDNNGLEGIAWYKNGQLFVGSQEDALLWIYKTDGTMVRRVKLTGETSQIEEVAGLFYDAKKDWLWVTDSDAGKLFIFSVGEFDLLASYDVSYIDNAESICVDRSHNCVWVGNDDDSPRLYKINFLF